MATDDCSLVGKGPCPCGNGVIEVERCSPDHPWAKPHQSYYRYSIQCDECRGAYGIHGDEPSKPGRLVRRAELDDIEAAQKAWHSKLREIEQSAEFAELRRLVAERLQQERSAAASYRVLSGARLASFSLQRYRKEGFQLSALDAQNAMNLVRAHLPELAALVRQEKEFGAAMRRTPAGIKTGIPGLSG